MTYLKNTVKTLLKLAVAAIIIIFLGHSVLSNWEMIRGYDWSFNPVLMILSCLIFAAAFGFLPWVWHMVLHYMGHELSYSDARDIFYIGNLGRYIPGKVWSIAGMAYMAEKSGIPATIAGTSAVFSQVYSMLSSFGFFLLFFIFRGTYSINAKVFWFLPVFFAAAVIFIFPSNMERVLNIVLKRIGKETVTLRITTVSALKIVALYFVSGLLFGCAFWIFVSSFIGLGEVNPVFAASAYIIAYWVGFLAFFVPGGIGVREGILGLLFMNIIPAGVLIIIAALSRLLVTIIEILFVLVAAFRKGFFINKKF
ncbi:lysylphosphatidylglycerol synthase domain-containing protein [Candidatus Latescibacterota bacterium]